MTTTTPGSLTEEAESLAGAAATRFLDRHEVPRHKQARLFSQIIRVSFSQAARKLRGTVGITIEELMELAFYFGASLNDVLATDTVTNPVPATWKLPQGTLKCLLWTRGLHEARADVQLIARNTSGGWVIEFASNPELDAEAIRIDKLVIHPAA